MMEFIAREPIDKGWSCDKKYRVTAADGTNYLLRVTQGEKAASRAEGFRMQQQVAALGVPMCLPVAYGACGGGVYILQSWIEGRDAEEAVPDLPEAEQYAYGVQAGKILKTIHSIPAPRSQPDWETRFNAKIDRNLRRYEECPFRFEGDAAVRRYVEENRYLLKNRPQCFQHGDYHIGNMMIDESGALRIIDFDRCDFGDPWEEFNRVVWCAQASPPFASGLVDGYFDNNVPPDFWRLLALYIGSTTLASLPWAIPFGEEEVRTILRQAKDVLRWYDGFRTVIPHWYNHQT